METECSAGRRHSAAPGLAEVLGLRLCGFRAWFAARTNHLRQLPLDSRKLRIVINGPVSLVRQGDTADFGD
jgi:hypothetical protein